MTTTLRAYEYYELARWIATPSFLREPKTQQEWQAQYNVSAMSVWRWKHDPNFKEDVRRFVDEWVELYHGDVTASIMLAAVEDRNPFSQKLWLDYIAKIPSKSAEKGNQDGQVETWAELMHRRHREVKGKQNVDGLTNG